jgi:hypothetical protein
MRHNVPPGCLLCFFFVIFLSAVALAKADAAFVVHAGGPAKVFSRLADSFCN